MRSVPRLKAFLFVCLLVWCAASFFVEPVQAQSQKVVTFKTEDGMTIYGTLHLPKNPGHPVAGVILFAEPEWIVRSTFDGANLGPNLIKNYGIAVLTVDFRGNAKSMNGKLFRTYSQKDRDKLQLDVRAAIKFLSSQEMVDPQRIGMVAVGVGANYALLEAAENPSVQGVVLISGDLSEDAKEFIRSREDVPILCLAGKDDKEGFRQMSEAYYLSRNKNSDIVLTMGHGTVMFNHTKGLDTKVMDWLAENVKGVGIASEVNFDTPDGWSLHGRLHLPDAAFEGKKVPAVVFVHGANHDEDTYYDLAKALVKQGFATLTYDWRGKNRDVGENKGNFLIDMKPGDQDNTALDVKSAINYMASQKGIDTSRMGLIAATLGTLYGIEGAIGDARIKAMVMLTQYVPSEKVKNFLSTSETPIFFIASTEDLNYEAGNLADYTRAAYRLSKSKETEFLLYDDAGRGSEMLKGKPELTPMIVRWFKDKLAQ